MANLERKQRILELYQTEKCYAVIAKIVGCTPSNVEYHCNPEVNRKVKEATINRIKILNNQLKTEFGGCCKLCGYSKCFAALQFHHRDPITKHEYRKKDGRKKGMLHLIQDYGYEEAVAEASKCDLLCANCHAEMEYS